MPNRLSGGQVWGFFHPGHHLGGEMRSRSLNWIPSHMGTISGLPSLEGGCAQLEPVPYNEPVIILCCGVAHFSNRR